MKEFTSIKQEVGEPNLSNEEMNIFHIMRGALKNVNLRESETVDQMVLRFDRIAQVILEKAPEGHDVEMYKHSINTCARRIEEFRLIHSMIKNGKDLALLEKMIAYAIICSTYDIALLAHQLMATTTRMDYITKSYETETARQSLLNLEELSSFTSHMKLEYCIVLEKFGVLYIKNGKMMNMVMYGTVQNAAFCVDDKVLFKGNLADMDDWLGEQGATRLGDEEVKTLCLRALEKANEETRK